MKHPDEYVVYFLAVGAIILFVYRISMWVYSFAR